METKTYLVTYDLKFTDGKEEILSAKSYQSIEKCEILDALKERLDDEIKEGNDLRREVFMLEQELGSRKSLLLFVITAFLIYLFWSIVFK